MSMTTSESADAATPRASAAFRAHCWSASWGAPKTQMRGKPGAGEALWPSVSLAWAGGREGSNPLQCILGQYALGCNSRSHDSKQSCSGLATRGKAARGGGVEV